MRLMYALVVLVLGALSPAAWSACTVTLSNAAFGSVTSIQVNTTPQPATANLVLSCDGILAVLGSNTISMAYTGAGSSASSRATLRNTVTGDTIPVRLCTKINCTENSEVTINGGYTWSGSLLLGLFNSRVYTLPLYFMTLSGQQVSAGNYEVLANLTINYNICNLLGLLCESSPAAGLSRSSTLSMTVTSDCQTITAPAVGFGSAPLVKSFPTISQNIVVTCTKNSPYTIGINNGIYPSGGVRYMASVNNPAVRMAYDIFKGSSTNRWGSSGAERRNHTDGTLAADNMTRTFGYTARILTTQATPAQVGEYKDTLTVDIVF